MRHILPVITAAGTVFLTADLGVFSSGDAAVVAMVLAALRPSLSPYLAITIATIQDARGLANFWAYIAFAGISVVALLWYLSIYYGDILHRRHDHRLPHGYTSLAAAAVTVIVYGFLVSIAQSHMGGYQQSTERHYALIAVAMVMMIFVAYAHLLLIDRQSRGLLKVRVVAGIGIVHCVSVMLLQSVLGPEPFHSSAGLVEIASASQLVDENVLGIPRLTGTFLSSNALALTVALLFMIILGTIPKGEISPGFVAIYLIAGMGISTAVFSKAMAVYFIFTSAILVWFSKSRTKAAVIAMIVVGPIAVLSYSNLDMLLTAFRFDMDATGYRGQAWEAVIRRFDWRAWIFGTGLSSWKPFFSNAVRFTLSDPHSYILSIPGTFGILGIFFYIFLGIALFQRLLSLANPSGRALALFLLALFFGKDLVSIPYVLGNTPITYLIWLCLGLLWLKHQAAGVEALSTLVTRRRIITT